MKRALAIALVAAASACTPNETAAPDLGPTRVLVAAASGVYDPLNGDALTVHLKNSGGAGAYYLTFVGTPGLGQPVPTRDTESVLVLAGYDEQTTYRITGISQVRAVRVFSRATNTATWTPTDCELLRGAATSYCLP